MVLIALPVAAVGATLVGISWFVLARRKSPTQFKDILKVDELDLPPGMAQEMKLDPAAREALKEGFSTGSDFQWIATKPGDKTYQKDTLRAITSYLIECVLNYVEKYGYMLVQRDEKGIYQGSICLIPPHKSWTVRNVQFMLSVIPLGKPVPEKMKCGKRFHDFGKVFEKHEELMKTMPDHWYVLNVGVAPNHQGKGIGKALLQAAKKNCLPSNKQGGALYLECHDENVPFYKKMGYDTLERYQLSTQEDGEPYFFNAMILRQK